MEKWEGSNHGDYLIPVSAREECMKERGTPKTLGPAPFNMSAVSKIIDAASSNNNATSKTANTAGSRRTSRRDVDADPNRL